MDKVIEVKDLCFGYESELILDKIEFSVNKGDFISIIGSNGAGKSTLMKLLLGELNAKSGNISLLGEDISNFKKWHKIGYVPQSGISKFSDFPATAEEVVKANLFSQIGFMRLAKSEHIEKTKKALQQVEMGDYAKQLIGKLSGGQQQRILIARVLVSKPQIMLLDEPATGIDYKTADSLYKLLSKLNRETGLTIVMVTHDVARASEYVSRTLCLEEGTIVELNNSQIYDELSHKHKHPHSHKGKEGI